MEIAIDFDGTVVKHEYPKVGANIGAQKILSELVVNGHSLILFTMRSGKELQDAVNWFTRNGIPLYGIQANPTQRDWTTSPKAYAQLYIDDAALGCPLKQDWESHPDGYYAGEPVPDGRPYVDWEIVRTMLKSKGIIK